MRLIDADDLMKKYELIDWYSVSKKGELMRGATSEDNPVIHFYDGEEVIKNATTIEAEPVRHGRWETELDDMGWIKHTCQFCGYAKRTDIHVALEWNFCPKCGARMDGDSNAEG